MNVRRLCLTLGGMVIGAVALPLLQAVAVVIDITAQHLPLGGTFANEVLRVLQLFGPWFALFGAILGGLSGFLLAAWLAKQRNSVRQSIGFNTIAALVFLVLTIHFAQRPISLRNLHVTLFFFAGNLALQWSFALVIISKTALNRLRYKLQYSAAS